MALSKNDLDRLVKHVQGGAEQAGKTFLDGMKADARDALIKEIDTRLRVASARPSALRDDRNDARRTPNPSPDDDDGPSLPMVFEGQDEEANLSRAACAWRLFHHKDDDARVFQKGHIAFCGSPDEWDAWCDARDIDSEGSDAWISEHDPDAQSDDDDEEHIEDIDFDALDMDVVQSMVFASPSADADFKAFHWGDKPDAIGLHELNLDGPFAEFCIVEKIWYRAMKGGKLQWFVHTFSEESGEPVWGIVPASKKALVIHGGNFHVEEDGLID